jgi:glycosyltransferase involved in cell wall biosynthesis
MAKYVGRCKIVYTVHDVMPFRYRSEWLLWPLLGVIHSLVDGFVFLSDSSHEEFVQRFPTQAAKPWIRIDHGAFDVKVDAAATRRARRASLLADEKPCFLVGFLGEIKDYKGLEILPLMPQRLDDGTPVRLVIAGRIDSTYRHIADPILARLEGDPIRIDRRLPNQELEGLIQAMDLVLLLYTRGWNSGMTMLALSAHARILTTRRPLFLEFQKALGEPWIYICDVGPVPDTASLARVLRSAQTDTVTADNEARLHEFLEERSFARVGQALLGFYDRLLRR